MQDAVLAKYRAFSAVTAEQDNLRIRSFGCNGVLSDEMLYAIEQHRCRKIRLAPDGCHAAEGKPIIDTILRNPLISVGGDDLAYHSRLLHKLVKTFSVSFRDPNELNH